MSRKHHGPNIMTEVVNFPDPDHVRHLLGSRSISLVGLMGTGKTSVGRKMAHILGLPFADADQEIEEAAGCSIADLFKLYGEPAFRNGEERVIERLLKEGAQILSTGGGAFMSKTTRERIAANGISVWLNTDLETLIRRTNRRDDRPLLNTEEPAQTLRRLMEKRNPVYAKADVTIASNTETVDNAAKLAIRAVADYLESRR